MMYSNFDQFKKYVEIFDIEEEEILQFIKDFAEEMAQRIIARTKKKTNVISGDMRRAWQVGDIVVNGDAIEAELLNGVEYASWVEYGTTNRDGTWRNGQFMLTISTKEVEEQMPLRLRKNFNIFLKSRGVQTDSGGTGGGSDE